MTAPLPPRSPAPRVRFGTLDMIGRTPRKAAPEFSGHLVRGSYVEGLLEERSREVPELEAALASMLAGEMPEARPWRG